MTFFFLRQNLNRETGASKTPHPCGMDGCTNHTRQWVSIHPYITMRRYVCPACWKKANEEVAA